MIARSLSSGSFALITSSPRCVRSMCTESLFGPTPLPSITSFVMALLTTSLEASSIFSGAYLAINLSPRLLYSSPPSPLAASEIRIPVPDSPVGWNCTNSISSSGNPCLATIDRPSPVFARAFEFILYDLAYPPVANITALALKILNSISLRL